MENIFSDYINEKETAFSTVVKLVEKLRPLDLESYKDLSKYQEDAINKIRAFSFVMEQKPELRDIARKAICAVLEQTRQVSLFVEQGILNNQSLITNVGNRIGERFLPLEPNEKSLRYLFGQLFNQKNDLFWLKNLPREAWREFWRSFHWEEVNLDQALAHTRQQLLESVLFLSARITAIGLEPEFVRLYPRIEQQESPFLHLNAEVHSYVINYQKALIDQEKSTHDEQHILVLLEQCEEILGKIRKNAAKFGISVNLTTLAVRLEQHLKRIKILISFLSYEEENKSQILLDFLFELVDAEARKHSVRDVFKSTTELLALRITEHAGQHGEHYIAESRLDWMLMFKAAMGAGFIVGFMALLKIMIANQHLPILLEGIVFGLMYSFGFMFIHILGFTIATKQPAMTAAKIAAVLQQQSGDKSYIKDLAALVINVLRTQFIAVVGNIALAVPTAIALAYIFDHFYGFKDISSYQATLFFKAEKTISGLNPWASLALFHAAIAGVYLFLSGLIAGYYDNKVVYRRIPERIAAHPTLIKHIGIHKSQRLGNYIGQNMGALFGNFYFGLFLGLTGSIGLILGLPIDIRHITFSSASFAVAAYSLEFNLPLQIWFTSILGIILVGVINLGMSFSLALLVAMRARKLHWADAAKITPIVFKKFLSEPWIFFWPTLSEEEKQARLDKKRLKENNTLNADAPTENTLEPHSNDASLTNNSHGETKNETT